MARNSLTLSDLIDSRIYYALGDLHTSLPSSVVKYDSTRQCVDIQPLLRKEYSNNFVIDLPIIKGVPLVFQGSSTSLISFPIEVGDIVLAVFCEKSIDKWVNSTGEVVTPRSGTMFDLSDCFAIPGLQTFRTHESPNPNNLEVRFNTNTANECSVKMKQDGSIDVNSPVKVNVNCPTAEFSGDVIVPNGDVTASGVSLVNHVHSGVQVGASNTGAPVNE